MLRLKTWTLAPDFVTIPHSYTRATHVVVNNYNSEQRHVNYTVNERQVDVTSDLTKQVGKKDKISDNFRQNFR